MIQSLAGLNGLEMTAGFHRTQVLWMIVGLSLIVWGLPNTQQMMARFAPVDGWSEVSRQLSPLPKWFRPLAWRPHPVAAVAVSAMALFVILNMSRFKEFLYFQF